MTAIVLAAAVLALLLASRPRPRAERLHLAEASDSELVSFRGREYLVVSDEGRVRVVSLAAAREEQVV